MKSSTFLLGLALSIFLLAILPSSEAAKTTKGAAKQKRQEIDVDSSDSDSSSESAEHSLDDEDPAVEAEAEDEGDEETNKEPAEELECYHCPDQETCAGPIEDQDPRAKGGFSNPEDPEKVYCITWYGIGDEQEGAVIGRYGKLEFVDRLEGDSGCLLKEEKELEICWCSTPLCNGEDLPCDKRQSPHATCSPIEESGEGGGEDEDKKRAAKGGPLAKHAPGARRAPAAKAGVKRASAAGSPARKPAKAPRSAAKARPAKRAPAAKGAKPLAG